MSTENNNNEGLVEINFVDEKTGEVIPELTFFLENEEFALIEEAAEKSGLSIGEFILAGIEELVAKLEEVSPHQGG